MYKRVFFMLTILSFIYNVGASPEKIAEVKAGKVKTAYASWWGFNANDSAEILQSAIDSGARTVIIDYTGKDWITSKTLKLPSNLELIIEDKVVLQARRGSFKRLGDALFLARGTKNTTVRGKGNATLKMHKRDYEDKSKYKLGEWRHIFNLAGVTDFTIKDLHLTGSGGDGIYAGSGRQGYCKNVLIENVSADDGNRLGMAIISAENLTIRNCRFTRSTGVSVGGGLDFEPNTRKERLVNCLVENCVLEGNRGAGVNISPNQLDSDAPPVSITLKDCRFQNNGLGFFLYPYHKRTAAPKTPAKGEVNFINCEFSGSSNLIQDAIAGYLRFNFKNCLFQPPASKKTAIQFVCKFSSDYQIGNVFFENSTMKCNPAVTVPLEISYQGTGSISDQIGGTLQIINGQEKTMFDFPALLKKKKDYFNRINSLTPAPSVDLNTLGRMKNPRSTGTNQACIRYKCSYRQYASAGDKVTVTAQGFSSGYPGNITVQLYTPGNKPVKKFTIPPDQKKHDIVFTAAETGYYFLKSQTIHRLALSSQLPGGAFELDKGMQILLPLAGRLYFEVPPGTGEFNIGLSADSPASVALINPEGKTIAADSKISSMTILTGRSTSKDCSEIWALEIRKAVWLMTLKMYAPLLPLVSLNPDTLPLKGNPDTAIRGFIPPEPKQESGAFRNAGFEMLRKNYPLYWQNPRIQGCTITPIQERPCEGKSALQIQTQAHVNLMSYSFIPAQPGQKIKASIQVRGKGKFNLQLLRYTAKDKKWIRPNRISQNFTINSDQWQQMSFETALPDQSPQDKTTGWIRYCITVLKDSDLVFDDCRI